MKRLAPSERATHRADREVKRVLLPGAAGDPGLNAFINDRTLHAASNDIVQGGFTRDVNDFCVETEIRI